MKIIREPDRELHCTIIPQPIATKAPVISQADDTTRCESVLADHPQKRKKLADNPDARTYERTGFDEMLKPES